jgi:Lipocalin-like domain
MIPRRTDMLFHLGPIAAALIGVWTLQEYSDITESLPPQHPFGFNPEGLLIYTPDGFVSAVLMAPDRPKLSGNGFTEGTSAQYTAAGKGFIGYSGIYDVDEALSVVTHRPHVAFAPNMIESRQRRLVELNGETLVLTAEHVQPGSAASTKSLLRWSRVKAGPAEEEQ